MFQGRAPRGFPGNFNLFFFLASKPTLKRTKAALRKGKTGAEKKNNTEKGQKPTLNKTKPALNNGSR